MLPAHRCIGGSSVLQRGDHILAFVVKDLKSFVEDRSQLGGDWANVNATTFVMLDRDLGPVLNVQARNSGELRHVEGVIAIAQGLSNLKVISLNRTTVGDRVAEALSKLPRLNDVRFSHTKLTDEGLSAFSGHPFLDVIYVRGCAVTESTTNMVKKTSPRRLTVYGV